MSKIQGQDKTVLPLKAHTRWTYVIKDERYKFA